MRVASSSKPHQVEIDRSILEAVMMGKWITEDDFRTAFTTWRCVLFVM